VRRTRKQAAAAGAVVRIWTRRQQRASGAYRAFFLTPLDGMKKAAAHAATPLTAFGGFASAGGIRRLPAWCHLPVTAA